MKVSGSFLFFFFWRGSKNDECGLGQKKGEGQLGTEVSGLIVSISLSRPPFLSFSTQLPRRG